MGTHELRKEKGTFEERGREREIGIFLPQKLPAYAEPHPMSRVASLTRGLQHKTGLNIE